VGPVGPAASDVEKYPITSTTTFAEPATKMLNVPLGDTGAITPVLTIVPAK
jgi:hypothetical protein